MTQLLPVPDAEEFVVSPRSSASTQAASRAAGERRAAAINRLVSHGVIADGTPDHHGCFRSELSYRRQPHEHTAIDRREPAAAAAVSLRFRWAAADGER